MMTDAWRRPRFSSCRAFTRSLYVSSSTLSTRLCCWSDSMRFCSCSRVTGDGGIMIGPPSIELESLSDALSRSAMFSTRANDNDNDDENDRGGSAGYRRLLFIARKLGGPSALSPACTLADASRFRAHRPPVGTAYGSDDYCGVIIARRTCAPVREERATETVSAVCAALARRLFSRARKWRGVP